MDIVKNIIIEKMINELNEYATEKKVLINTCEKMIEEYNNKIKVLKEKIDEKENYVKAEIMSMLQYEEYKETKTQLSYCVPSAKIVRKKESYTIEKDDTKLLEFLKENGTEFIKVETKEKIDWVNLKKDLKIVDNKTIINNNGEIIEGCSVKKIPEKIEIKFD